MRILHVLGDRALPRQPHAAPTSGITRATLEIARGQAAMGHTVSVAALGVERWTDEWQGVRLIGMTKPPLLPGSTALGGHLAFVALTHVRSFDVVHGTGYMRFLRAGLRAYHYHRDPEKKPIHDGSFATIARDTDLQFAVSNYVGRGLDARMGQAGNVKVVPNGVDADAFRPEAYRARRRELRAEWGVSDGDVVFLFAGAWVPDKGVHVLAEAFADVARDMGHTHLALAGGAGLWGGSSRKAEAAASSAEEYDTELAASFARVPASRLHRLGMIASSDMPAVYAAADAVVVPSIWGEPAPLVALEALASGRPVIASNVGGLPEVIRESNGRIVEPNDAKGLAVALAELAACLNGGCFPESEVRATVAGRTWRTVAQEIGEHYAAAIEAKKHHVPT